MKRLLASFIAVCMASLAIWYATPSRSGVSCSVPFNLQNNTIADATQVMANYNALITCLGNAAAAGANSDITSLLGLLTPIPPTSGGSNVFIAGTSTGSANAQVVASTTPTGFTLTNGYSVIFTAGFTNTGAMTLNVNAQGAKSVFHISPGGVEALTGGEVVSGQLVHAIYDGTQFQLINVTNQLGGMGPATAITASTTTDLTIAINHNAVVNGSGVTISSLGSPGDLNFPQYFVRFTGANTLVNSSTLLLPGAANILTAAGDTIRAQLLGAAGTWRVSEYQKANGTAVVNPTPLAGFTKLSITNNAGTPNTSIDYSATSAVLINSAGGNVPSYITSLSGTVNLTLGTVTSTCNAMDGEVRGTSQWLYLWEVSDGTTPCMIASTSATTPTLPTNYVYSAYAGAMRVDGSGNLFRTWQKGQQGFYVVANGSNVPFLTPLASANTGLTTWTSIALGNFIPTTTASRVKLVANAVGSGDLAVVPNNNYPVASSTNSIGNPCTVSFSAGAGNASVLCELTLESTNVFYASNATTNGVYIYGWTDGQVNAN